MYEVSGVNVKVERGPTLTFTRARDLSYIACTCLYLRAYAPVLKLHDSGIHPHFKQMTLSEGILCSVWIDVDKKKLKQEH